MSNEEKANHEIQLPEEMKTAFKKLGLAVPIWDRPITKEEIQYFLDRWAFLQILSTNEVAAPPSVQKMRAKTNWVILNYGDALTSSPGEFLFGVNEGLSEKEEEDGGSGDLIPAGGTVWAQAYLTCEEMIALARGLGWEGVHIVDGHPLMKWAAWMHAKEEGLFVTGFEPTEKDLARRERLKRSEVEDAKRFTYRR